MRVAAILCVTLATIPVFGVLVNRTIDDFAGDEMTGLQVVYQPPGFWDQEVNCTTCGVDSSSLNDGTYHSATATGNPDEPPLTFSLLFNGLAVYVFGILVSNLTTDVVFTLDGQPIHEFLKELTGEVKFTYNVPMLSMGSLPYGEHNLSVHTVGTEVNVIAFDYAVYTTNVSDPTPAPTPSEGSSARSRRLDTFFGSAVEAGVRVLVLFTFAVLLY